jgi:hypothetical protein
MRPRAPHRSPQQAFGGNGWPADLQRIKRIKISAQIGQRSVDELTDLPQRMIGPHPLLQIHVRKQRPRPDIRTAHRLVSCSWQKNRIMLRTMALRTS